MKKIAILSISLLLFSCKPIIFDYRPINSDLSKEGKFYYLATDNGRIGYFPRVWINPRGGLECEILFYGIEITSVKGIEILNNDGVKIIEIPQDSIQNLYVPYNNKIQIFQAEKGKLVKKGELKKLDTIRVNINLGNTLISVPFEVMTKTKQMQ